MSTRERTRAIVRGIDPFTAFLRMHRIEREDGQGLVEYAFILSLVSLVCVAGVTQIGEITISLYTISEYLR